MNGPKIYFTIPLFGGIGITQTTVSSFVVMLLLCIAAVVLGSNLQKRPSRRQVLVEKGVTMLYDMVESTMGKHNSYWTPYIGALFLSSICGSFIGMTGIFRSSTADLSTTVTWALMTSFICWGCSIKRNGVGGWLKGFTEPIVVMTPMNLVSEIAQPISMAFRHFGNIAGGSVLTSLVYSALATVSAAVLGLVGKSVIVGSSRSDSRRGAVVQRRQDEKAGAQDLRHRFRRDWRTLPFGADRRTVSGGRCPRNPEPVFRYFLRRRTSPCFQPVDNGVRGQCLPAPGGSLNPYLLFRRIFLWKLQS
ncbi:MAG: FoF1 ATP synthase subunit a [Gemmiger formicilis]